MLSLSPFLITQRIYNPQIIEPIRNYTGWEYVNRLIPILIFLAFIISVVVCVILIIIGGLKWVTSGGNKEAIASARNTVTNAVIGLFLLFCLYFVIIEIHCIFKVDLGYLNIPSWCGESGGGVPTPTLTPAPSATPNPTIVPTATPIPVCGGGISCTWSGCSALGSAGGVGSCPISGYHRIWGSSCSTAGQTGTCVYSDCRGGSPPAGCSIGKNGYPTVWWSCYCKAN